MTTIYKGDTPILGGGYGTVNKANSATTAATASNAQLLNGVSQKRILEKWGTVETSLGSTGWYRIGRTLGKNNGTAKGGILILERGYGYGYSEMYVLSISIGYNQHYSVTQLSGIRNVATTDSPDTKLIKLRLLMANDNYWYVDVYYNSGNANNVIATGIGGLVMNDRIEPSVIPSGYTASADIPLVIGFKSTVVGA